MRILVLCEEGNKRSVVLAHQLKYLGHDVLTAGLRRNEPATKVMLTRWAELIIITSHDQREGVEACTGDVDKIVCWELGPDKYPQSFHPELLAKCKKLIKDNPL